MRIPVAILIVASATAAVAGLAARAPQEPGPGGRGMFPGSPVFAALDANGDGLVSAAELSDSPKALLALDRNRDGQLSQEELAPPFGRGARRGGFGGEGRGGRGGREGRGDSTSSAPDDLADTLMAFDRNTDGRLERTEVPERFQGLFDRADANKDGVLTRDELRQSAASNEDARGEGDGRGGFGDRAVSTAEIMPAGGRGGRGGRGFGGRQ
jgi:hypothetical protein